jgi:tetratricopeptide (TPR) repeat protein
MHGRAAMGARLGLAAAAVLAVAAAAAGCSRPAGPPPPGAAAGAAAGGTSESPAGAFGSAATAGGTTAGAGQQPPPVVPELARLARAARGGRPVLFVGLDGADWQLLDGYLADGTMPNLAGLARQGVAGVLRTIQPPLSPLVWTTMMTGVSPLAHRVLDFTRFNPATGAREPIGSDERRAPAVWNMASAAGKTVAVFGLWATYPAEPVRGLLVADRFASFTAGDRRPPPGVVFPASREGWAREVLAAAVRDTGYAELRRYLPWLDEDEYRRQVAQPEPYAHPVSALRRILAETRAYHALARAWIERARPDLAVVYFEGTDTLGHIFAPYAPPRQAAVSEADFARFGGVPRLYFAEIDRLLGDFRDLAASQGAVLFVASDHGFRWREGRPAALSSAAAATAARWHREEGIYLLWAGAGRGGAGGRRGSGGVAQVCATLLALLGLPPGTGLAPALAAVHQLAGPKAAGAELAAAPSAREPAPLPEIDYRRYFHPAAPATAAPAETVRAAGSATSSPPAGAGDDEQLAALRALGYIGAGEPSRRALAPSTAPAPSDATRTAASFDNEGLLLRQQGQETAARAAFEQALARQPDLPAALWNLSDLLFAEAGPAIPPSGSPTPAGRGAFPHPEVLDRADDLLLRALAGGLPDGVERLLERAGRYRRAGGADRGLALLDRALALRPADSRLWLARGRDRLERQRCAAAYDDFTRAAALDPASALAEASRGLALLCRGDQPGALAAFRRSLALDPNQPEIRRFLAHP